MPDTDRLRSDLGEGAAPAKYALSAVVYAERGDEILLLQRADGTALAGEWFLPGGMVEPGEAPEDAARRELAEEAGVEIEGELELVGCSLMHVYGHDMLQLSYRGSVSERGAVVVSHEHDGAQWVKAQDMRALLTDEVVDQIARGDGRVRALVQNIRTDLDRYLKRVSSLVGGHQHP